MTSKFDKLEKFKGHDFHRWQKKMHFLLTTLKVMYVLSTPSPVWSENETLETTRIRMKWENDDYICRGHILNGMSDSLFDIYQKAESVKALWESLESKYMAKDAFATKFLVSSFMNYKMVDTRPVMEQYHEMLRILGQYTQHKLMMDEAISVAVIIDKLPPSWKEFKHGKNQIGSSSVNVVEGDRAKNSNNNKNKRKFKSGDDKFANKNGTMTCWKCKKTGHMKKDCPSRKGNDGAGSNGSKDPEKQQVAWWVDSGAISHVCKDLRWFQVCKSIKDGSIVKMGNIATEPIKGMGRVLLTFTFGKTLCLDNVLYKPGIRKNLVSKIVLNKYGYKQGLESDKYILSRHGSFVGFGYVCNEPNDYVSVNSIIESRDAIFDEERFTSIPKPEETRDKTLSQREYCFIIEDDPRILSEAMASRDVSFWKEAVQSEIDSIMHNDTWELTDLPPGCKVLGCKWILKRKMKVDGSIDK
nr:hypothetical protein [Tanacetum cinerariifolium]